MFENLTNKLQDALKKLRGQAVISESNIAESMKDIREALLEADVNREVAEDFVSKVAKECLGESVLRLKSQPKRTHLRLSAAHYSMTPLLSASSAFRRRRS